MRRMGYRQTRGKIAWGQMGSEPQGSPTGLYETPGGHSAWTDRGQSTLQLVQSDDEPQLAEHAEREEATTTHRGARTLAIRMLSL